jgi:DNA-binding response OmpR family regulator
MASPKQTILVVDDDPSLRLLCRVNLELEGFEVREAATSDEARSAVAEAQPDGVLLDFHLGADGDSFELLAELKAAGVHVALVTGDADAAELHPLADEVVSKPFMPNDLVAAARRLATVAGR